MKLYIHIQMFTVFVNVHMFTSAENDCRDKQPICSVWSQKGYCNTGFMKSQCKLSCNLCDNNPGPQSTAQGVGPVTFDKNQQSSILIQQPSTFSVSPPRQQVQQTFVQRFQKPSLRHPNFVCGTSSSNNIVRSKRDLNVVTLSRVTRQAGGSRRRFGGLLKGVVQASKKIGGSRNGFRGSVQKFGGFVKNVVKSSKGPSRPHGGNSGYKQVGGNPTNNHPSVVAVGNVRRPYYNYYNRYRGNNGRTQYINRNRNRVNYNTHRPRPQSFQQSRPVTQVQFPSQPTNVPDYTSEWICGGVMITDQFLLSAAHCFLDDIPNAIRIGAYDIANPSEPQARNVEIEQVYIHPDFRYPVLYNDIALVKLRRRINFRNGESPTCLATDSSNTYEGYISTANGYGRLNAENHSITESTVLQELNLKVTSNDECNQVYNRFPKVRRSYPNGITKDIICAGGEIGKDACQGDSGGPLTIRVNGKWTLIGIVSSGIGCGQGGIPGIYTRVSEYIDWMDSIIYG